jgi:type IV fimbrial biogenesis protein FimT
MKVCRGFTLLELMVAIAVLAILATVGVPSFNELIQNNRVTTQTNELVSALNFARTDAIKRGRNVEVTVTQAAPGWRAEVSVPAIVAAPSFPGDGVLRVVDRQGSRVAVDADVTIIFGPTGVPNASRAFGMEPGGSCTGQKRREIVVGASGQITTTRASCSGG